ncbi:acetyl-CoA decarbonylase/synthase complex subunit delta [Fusibacillus kribbianus]|uniref:Acetyl-CoA decarbonylase/synthase complex subunit delta n=1 Tax=Fusibacillus kribbianus TaxID=3044208 RepID=A0AAP4B7T4_9FIRM|nr:acetyl-CoA decarbonylase/synthase complex subunit delta [Ruminococcus sp. YH-rum2234]MDI9241205.1 acetyl-CoA decarbonylase/synthase complex subunit delta [Ruminococcus sp. YH-rum2234]
MPLNKKLQKFSATVRSVELGTGDKTTTLGGGNTYPFYTFDNPTANPAKIGIEISDLGLADEPDCIKEFYAGCETVVDMAKKAVTVEGADFLVLKLIGGDPNGENKSIEELVEVAKAVADAVDFPLVVEGCKNVEKDAQLLAKVAEALQGKNVLLMSAKEENYKNVGAAAGLAYDQLLGAESAVDINLAKQLNVLIKQLGVDPGKVVMNVGSAAAGYGFDYCISTLDRVKGAALGQSDDSLLMPIITPVADETWSVKEASASEEDVPEWGSVVERAIDMEITTAVACLSCGSDAVILKHPTSIATVSAMIKALV